MSDAMRARCRKCLIQVPLAAATSYTCGVAALSDAALLRAAFVRM